MRTLDMVLFESRLRAENIKHAVQLGIFGDNLPEIINNVKQFNVDKQPQIDRICNEVKDIINRKEEHTL